MYPAGVCRSNRYGALAGFNVGAEKSPHYWGIVKVGDEQCRRQTTFSLSLGQKLDDASLSLSLLQCLACMLRVGHTYFSKKSPRGYLVVQFHVYGCLAKHA
jgi:hypothetical protein